MLGTVGPVGPIVVAEAASPPTTEVPGTAVPDSTINEFIPEDRAIGDCISAVPKPGCGSESRTDWHQWLVLIALAGGIGFVGRGGVGRPPPPARPPHPVLNPA